MTLLIQPDGALFKVVTSGAAGQNVVGPRLWQWGFAKCKPKKENHLKGDAEPQEFNITKLPTCPATGLTHEQAVQVKAEWEIFLRKQDRKEH